MATNYDKIKNMGIEEMAQFITSLVDGENQHNIGCYGCINYGTHHFYDGDCENEPCANFPIGLDVKKYLKTEA